MTATAVPPRAPAAGRPASGRVLHAEWTKFRTVRGWIIGMVVAAAHGRGRPARRPAPVSPALMAQAHRYTTARPASRPCLSARAVSP